MPMPKRTRKPVTAVQPLIIGATETEAGLQWLNSLPEDQFRDRILLEVFRKMQAEGDLEAFENIHGRNDKGVDYILLHRSAFGSTLRGIQVKSKRITRSESSGALSAVRIREECQSAMLQEFHFQGRNVRLDIIDLWCSAPMTEDAEKEFNPPHAHNRIVIKKDRELLSLVEKYCPTLLAKVPQFAIAKYIAESRNPGPKAVRILGCNLNPSVHFIEPFFSSQPLTSPKQLKIKNHFLSPSREKITLQTIIDEVAHAVICAPPLSGRSYLLEHLKCRFAQAGRICILLAGADIPRTDFKIETLLARHLDFASPNQVRNLQASIGIVLLVDDIEKCPPEARQKLFNAEPKAVRIVATARNIVPHPAARIYHVGGVDWMSIVQFLRTLDNKLAAGKPFVDRARVFIDRAFQTSGLPKNPFTIAVMLEECHHSVSKFNTPTMGRLIGRFIELQLGSHADNTYAVDFETKREFLTRLAGHCQFSFPINEFEKLLGKFIEMKGHPHSITDFSNDLLRSGVFQRTGDIVEWAHPVIKEFFWVKNLVSQKKLGPIEKRLAASLDPTLAALAGSQLEDAGDLLRSLLARVEKINLPTFAEILFSPEFAAPLSGLISETDEETLLTNLENGNLFSQTANQFKPRSSPGATSASSVQTQPVKLTPEQQLALKKRMEPVIKRFAESELHIAFNIAAVLINARDTSRPHKEQAVQAVLSASQMLAQFMDDLIAAAMGDSKKLSFFSTWLKVITLCSLADEMLGDPHLVSIFRSVLRQNKDQTRTLALLDLLLCCGEDDHDRIIQELEKANHLGVTLAFYWRVAMLYFFRFHRDIDRAALRKLLSTIRKMERHIELPHLV